MKRKRKWEAGGLEGLDSMWMKNLTQNTHVLGTVC